MARKEDIRIRKTKEKLRAGLLELMKNENIEDVSVTELCRFSGVNRNTFYAHYKEPAELLAEIENELVKTLYSTLSNASLKNMSMYTFLNSLFTLIYEEKDVCSIIFSKHGNRSFIYQVTDMVKDSVTSDWISKGITELEANVMFSYCVSGSLGVLEAWILEGYKTPVAELTQILTSLVISGQSNIRA